MKQRVLISHRLFSRSSGANSPKIVLKGDTAPNKIQSVKTRDASGDEVIITQMEEATVKVNLATLRNKIEYMRLKMNTPTKLMSNEDSNIYMHLITTRDHLKNTGMVDHMDDIIRDIFKDVKVVIPGTIGAYFHGCFTNNNFRGNPACAASCAGSISYDNGTRGWQDCENICLLYDGRGTFHTLSENHDMRNAYIFISDHSKFSGFTREDINALKAKGVEKAKLVVYTDGSSYKELSEDFVELGKLPSRNGNTREVKRETTSSNSAMGVIIFLILFILIAILVYFLMRKTSN